MNEPRPYVRSVPRATWYLAQPRYVQHVAQELTCVFVGAYALFLLWGLRALSQGEHAWNAFLTSLGNPLALLLQLLVLAATLYHTVSWFAVTPKAMPVQVGEGFVPGIIIAGAHYLAWIIVSLFILYIAGVF